MIRRPVMAVALLSAAILPFAGLTPSQAQGQGRVSFSRQAITPATAKGGATITARVRVTPSRGATVSGATLRLVRSGTQLSSKSMSRSGNDFTTTFQAPANTSTKTVSIEVWADAQTSLGVRPTRLGTLKVTSTPVDPNLPPPPPPI